MALVRCKKCGEEVEGEVRFCGFCGVAHPSGSEAGGEGRASDGALARFRYNMIQIPPAVMSEMKRGGGDTEAADYLSRIANREAQEGWEFQRVDTMNVIEPPGCLSQGPPVSKPVYVMTFRKPIGSRDTGS